MGTIVEKEEVIVKGQVILPTSWPISGTCGILEKIQKRMLRPRQVLAVTVKGASEREELINITTE
jgi:hypothetical protein